jgi:hypothetical protein
LAFQPSRLLLDKGIVRRLYEAQVRRSHRIPPTPLQREALTVFIRLRLLPAKLYIAQESANLLSLRPQRYTIPITRRTSALYKGRYFSRWARRLRSFTFSPEDARMLAYASFGVTFNMQLAEVEIFVTNDNHLARNFQVEHTKIEVRFDRMVGNLREPYSGLQLPEVMTTAEVLAVT